MGVESLDNMKVPTVPKSPEGRKLFELLDIASSRHLIQGRIRDLKKSSKALAMEIEILLHECDNLAMRLEIHVTDQIGQNYGDMFGVTNSLKAMGCSLYLMRVVIAGSLAFAILDRASGKWQNISDGMMIGFLENVFSSAFLWVILSAMLAGGLLFWSYKYTLAKISQGERYAQIRINLNEKMKSRNNLEGYLSTKEVVNGISMFEKARGTTGLDKNVTRLKWHEEGAQWGGVPVEIELDYDDQNLFLTSLWSRSLGARSEAPTSLLFNQTN